MWCPFKSLTLVSCTSHSSEHSWCSGLSLCHQETSGISHWTSPVTFNILEESYWARGLNTNQNTPKAHKSQQPPFCFSQPVHNDGIGGFGRWMILPSMDVGRVPRSVRAVEEHRAPLCEALRTRWEVGAAQRCAHSGPAVAVGGNAAALEEVLSSKCCLCSEGSQRSSSTLCVCFRWSRPSPAGAPGAAVLPWIAKMGQKRGEVLGWDVIQVGFQKLSGTKHRAVGHTCCFFARERVELHDGRAQVGSARATVQQNPSSKRQQTTTIAGEQFWDKPASASCCWPWRCAEQSK